MRHRAVIRATSPAAPPRTNDERRLETLQARITQAQQQVNNLIVQRDHLALHLWLDARVAQSEIAERLDRADRRAGGNGVSYAAMQKRMNRLQQANSAMLSTG